MAGKNLDQWIKEIEDRDPSHRVVAITAVLQFGPPAKKAVPAPKAKPKVRGTVVIPSDPYGF